MENKKKNPVDDLFRRKLNEEQLVPDDSLWNEIETKLDEKKPPRRRIIIWIVLGVLLLGGVSSILHFKNENMVVGENTNNGGAVVSENTNKGNGANSSTAQTENLNSSSSKNNSTAQTQQVNSGNKTSGFKSIGKVVGENTNNGSYGNKKVGAKNSKNGNAVGNENKKVGDDISKHGLTSDENLVGNEIIQGDATNYTEGNKPYGEYINESENSVAKNSNSTQQQNTNDNANNGTAQNQTILDSLAVVNQKKIIEPLRIEPVKEKKWFIEVGSSFINNKNQSSYGGTFGIQDIDSLYTYQRSSNEQSATTFNYNVNVGMNVHRFQFKSGIDIMRFGENIQYENRGHCWMLQSNGYYNIDSTFVVTGYDTLSAHTQVNNLVTAHNGKSVNTYLSIPLMVSYSLPIKSFKLQVGLGGYAGFPLQWNSYYLNREVTDLINFSDEGLLRKMILGYQFNAGVAVPLSKHFDAMLAYEYRRNLTQVEKRSYISSKRFYGGGANLSVRYNF